MAIRRGKGAESPCLSVRFLGAGMVDGSGRITLLHVIARYEAIYKLCRSMEIDFVQERNAERLIVRRRDCFILRNDAR